MEQTKLNTKEIEQAFLNFIEAETDGPNNKKRFLEMLPKMIEKIQSCQAQFPAAENRWRHMRCKDVPKDPNTGDNKELYFPVVYLYFLEPRLSSETRRYNEIKDNNKLVLRKELIYGGNTYTERINIILTNRGYGFKKYRKEGENDYACETFDNVEQLLHFFVPGYSDDPFTTRYGFTDECYTLYKND